MSEESGSYLIAGITEADETEIYPGNYSRMFRANTARALDESNLSVYALAFLKRFEGYITNKYNAIKIDNKYPTIKILANKLQVKPTKMSYILNELEEKGFRKRDRDGRNIIIYFNPYLFSAWKKVKNTTLNMFHEYIRYY